MISKIDRYIEYLIGRKTDPKVIPGLVRKKFGSFNVWEYQKSGQSKYLYLAGMPGNLF
jgi:hypothetical protein